MIDVDIRGDVKELTRMLKDVQRNIVPQVTVTALNKTGTKLKTATATRIARQTGIPKKFIAGTGAKAKVKVNGRLKLYRANKHHKSIKLWMGAYNISAASLGKIKETRSGVVKVGKVSFSGAFKATMPNGHVDYYQRKTGKRYPIKKASIDIKRESTRAMLYSKNILAPPEFKKQFNQALEWKLRKYG